MNQLLHSLRKCNFTALCRVLRAFPVQELPGEGGSIDVEMDPVDEAAVRAAIQEQHGMRCVYLAVWRLIWKGLVREHVSQCRS